MGWQTEGQLSHQEGTTILKTGGSTLKCILLQAPFTAADFALRTFTFANIGARELTGVAAGYTSGVGGVTLVGARAFRNTGTTNGFDIANHQFTGILLTAGTAVCPGFAITDSTNSKLIATIPFDVPVDLDAVLATDILVTFDPTDTTGFFGWYNG